MQCISPVLLKLAVEYDFWCLVDAETYGSPPTIANEERVFGLFIGRMNVMRWHSRC